MLRRLLLRDFVIVPELEVEWGPGFTALTGETGAGKSILIDALQLALGSRAEAAVVREGATKADISAEFDTPPSLQPWLLEAGFDALDSDGLLLRRVIDAQGKSRAWVNGCPASVTQLREAAEHLVDIHGQHAWQSLTRPAAVRALLDDLAQVDSRSLAQAHSQWREAEQACAKAQAEQAQLASERDRLQWQLSELAKLNPSTGEWDELNQEHRRLSNAQGLLDAARGALDALSEGEFNALALTHRAAEYLLAVSEHDASLGDMARSLQEALPVLEDAAHSLSTYWHQTELDPERLQTLDERLSVWMGMARRHRRPPAELPQLMAQWQAQLEELEAASDLPALEARVTRRREAYESLAHRATSQREKAAPQLASAVTQAMQSLGMAGGRFEVALHPQEEAQSYGLENVEFLVAGHVGSSPRPLAKVASGGELSRLALAIAVCTKHSEIGATSASQVGTLIFDEIDAGVGGAVAEAVGRMMRQLAASCQVLAVTHLPQVAACAHTHFVVKKSAAEGRTSSEVQGVEGTQRTQEIARMLGGERLTQAALAHAQELLCAAGQDGLK